MIILEQEYQKQQYLSFDKKVQLAARLGMKEETVRIWFQNKRNVMVLERKKQRRTLITSLSTDLGLETENSSG